MNKIYLVLIYTTGIAAAVILFAIVVLIFLQVLFRYLIHQPLSWTVELSRFLFAWVSMLGAAAAAPEIFNQGIDLLVKRFSEKAQLLVDLFARLLTAATSCVLIVYAVDLTGRVHSQLSSVLRIRMSFVYSAIPAGLFLFLVIFVLNSYLVYSKTDTGAQGGFVEKLKRIAGE